MKLTYCLFITLFFITTISFAQTPGYSIKGIVADSVTQKPAGYVTLSLKNEAKAAIKSTLTKTDGSFSFEKLPAGKYAISIIDIGYKSKTIAVDLGADKDMETVYISPQATGLKEVVISVDKPLVKQEVDRLTYDLQADPESKVNSVLDMMRKVPLLSVDADDNILLKGDANYKILINGRTSSMSGKEILRSMPASTIQSIEVITTPPAKYDAEGIAGIINIITTKKITNGYNGSANINDRVPVGGPGLGGALTLKQGKFGMSLLSGGSLNKAKQTPFSNLRTSIGTNPSTLLQTAVRENKGRAGYFSSELSFEIDTLNLISGQFNINGRRNDGKTNRVSLLTDQTGVLEGYTLDNNIKYIGSGTDASLNYQLGFKSNKARLLTLSYRYYGFGSNQFYRVDVSNPVKYATTNYRENDDATSSEQTFQLDYVQPLKKVKMEAGLKGILRINKSDFQYTYLNTSTGQYVLDPDRTNKFNNTQNVFGAYNTYQYNLKNWDLKAGFRIEQTVIDADFISSAKQVGQNYFNIVPSFSVNRRFKDKSSLNFSFTQRIQRPGIGQLNPYVDRQNPSIVATGNPDLRPLSGNLFQLGYNKSKKASVNIGFSYSYFKNLIMQTYVFDRATNITLMGWANTGLARLFGNDFSINYPVTKKWNVSVNSNLQYGQIQGMVDGALIKNDGWMYNFSTTSGYRFEKGLRVNANFFMNGPGLALHGTTSNAFSGSSFSLTQDLVKDKFSFSASVNNPFTKFRTNKLQTSGPNFLQVSEDHYYFRSFGVNLNYRFGKLKDAIKKAKRTINNDDVNQ